MKNNPLGKKTKVINKYSPEVLFGVPRVSGRKSNGIKDLFFSGFDVFNCYELMWLDKQGKPEVRRLKIIYPSSSPNIVESKSLKLYLFSLSFTHFEDEKNVIRTIKKDLVKVLWTEDLLIELYKFDKNISYTVIPKKYLLDEMNIKVDNYKIDLKIFEIRESNKKVTERYSNLLLTNCPVTRQPDFGTLYIKYKSNLQITDESLLRYIVSMRGHFDFHESACEKVFIDIFNKLNPKALVVKCFYTRRGGIDINPVRFFGESVNEKTDFHFWRQ